MIDYSLYYDRPLEEPTEDAKQFERYLTYRNMNPLDRSMRGATKMLNARQDSVTLKTIQNTAHKYKWSTRAKAYDNHLSSVELAIIETDKAEYITDLFEQEDVENAIATDMVQTLLRNTQRKLKAGGDDAPDEMAVQRVIKTMENVQNLRRRRGDIPIEFTKERVEEVVTSDTYIMGG